MKHLLVAVCLGVIGVGGLSCGSTDEPGAADATRVDARLMDAPAPDAQSPDAGPPVWACCTIDGSQCTQELSQQDCINNGGYSFWPQTFCADHTCTNEVQGACCDQDGCQDPVTVDACSGTHFGAGTVCADVVCN